MVTNSKEVERKPGSEQVDILEGNPRVEPKVGEEGEQSRDNLEVSSWIEKIEKKFGRVPNTTSDASDDQVVVQPSGSTQVQQPPITLPINAKQMKAGKTAGSDLSIAWLVTWVIRQIKKITKLGGKVRLQDIPEVKNNE